MYSVPISKQQLTSQLLKIEGVLKFHFQISYKKACPFLQFMSSFHTCSDKLELDEKLGWWAIHGWASPSGNPEKDLKSQWILLYLDRLLCLYVND